MNWNDHQYTQNFISSLSARDEWVRNEREGGGAREVGEGGKIASERGRKRETGRVVAVIRLLRVFPRRVNTDTKH